MVCLLLNKHFSAILRLFLQFIAPLIRWVIRICIIECNRYELSILLLIAANWLISYVYRWPRVTTIRWLAIKTSLVTLNLIS